jgi:purine-binding chemotaxis protein CheW
MPQAFLVFRVAERQCAIPAAAVQETLHLAATLQAPGQPPVLHGFLNLRGSMVPVVSLRALLGSDMGTPDLHAPMIVVREGGQLLVLLADELLDVVAVDPEALEPLPSNHSPNDCAQSVLPTSEGAVTVLSLDRLLLAKERECIAALQARLAEREREAEGTPG